MQIVSISILAYTRNEYQSTAQSPNLSKYDSPLNIINRTGFPSEIAVTERNSTAIAMAFKVRHCPAGAWMRDAKPKLPKMSHE